MNTTTRTIARQRGYSALTVSYRPAESGLLERAIRQLRGRPHLIVQTRAGLSVWIPSPPTASERLQAAYRTSGKHRATA